MGLTSLELPGIPSFRWKCSKLQNFLHKIPADGANLEVPHQPVSGCSGCFAIPTSWRSEINASEVTNKVERTLEKACSIFWESSMISFSAVANVTTTSVIESGSILGRDLALTWEANRYECGTSKQKCSILRGDESDDLIMDSHCQAQYSDNHWFQCGICHAVPRLISLSPTSP